MGTFPSLALSLPRDIIDNDLPCPVLGLTALLRAFAGVGVGALCIPPFDGPLTTLSDKVGLWPLAACPLSAVLATDGVRRVAGLPCTREDLLLCCAEAAGSGRLSLGHPLAAGVCPSLFCSCSGPSATFLNVMIHSISSPAYTDVSRHLTLARIFEGAGAGGIFGDVRDRCGARYDQEEALSRTADVRIVQWNIWTV
jgi:hypothetical protein